MSEILIRKDENSITTLSFNDLPANSLSMPMMTKIQKELSDIDKDSFDVSNQNTWYFPDQ